MVTPSPHLIVLAGPNGAGKSTSAPALLRGTLRVEEFVNADIIARGLSAFRPENAAIEAGRAMMARLKNLAIKRVDFAFETTLASRSFAPWIRGLLEQGYSFTLVFLWLPSVEMALSRVRERVQGGGHSVPEETVRRRYRSGLKGFFQIYRPLATAWRFYDNGSRRGPILLAKGRGLVETRVADRRLWQSIKVEYEHEPGR
ncbi:MAG: hypothetical protein AUI36_42265 [Cyanobacteria bacterium 13_1_40CM_2_61_4]|nr:MAG: hypothetical protein AUI36_42265 [Cyanobacteria bacterium 13_1_40CM_2_61_4]